MRINLSKNRKQFTKFFTLVLLITSPYIPIDSVYFKTPYLGTPTNGTTTFNGLIASSGQVTSGTGSSSVTNFLSTGWDFEVQSTGATNTQITQISDQGQDAATTDDDVIQFVGGGLVIDYVKISSNDGSEFKLNSVDVRFQGAGNNTITVRAYKNSIAIGTAAFSTGSLTAFDWHTIDVSAQTDFNDADEFRIFSGATNRFSVIRVDNINISTAASSDTDSPTFDTAPLASSVTTTGFTAGASIDEGGDIYYVVVADGATAPTPANVIAGQANGGGSPIASGSGTNLTDPFTLSSAVTSLTAGTAYDVYFIARDDESTPNVQATVTKVDVTTLAPSSLQIAATVFLEGAYNGTSLNTTINSSIPAQQPYNGVNSHSQTTSVSIPASAVDWVLVELREASTAATATNATRKGSTAGFLMNDGTIKATDGTSNLTINLTGNTGTDYYVVIYHRNHLPIMSAAAIDGSGGTLTIDFTSNSANTYQTTTALASLTNNKFGMPSGDLNQDGSINSTDLSTWRTNNGAAYSYSGNGNADFNLDGEINAVDRNDFQQKNTSKTRQVPTT
ncbi:dockerin type I domain-containing protein [Roseivirga misakiensis]|uniref:Dockerin domain-containing protein n=1 Tax=Roseivirga misakiensis TaxID=1563681 RepID=A0A1E5T7B9_9BACT|nr:dockerin type I domain-containing protein [Roseivirga misakiensis]OEK07197.1 hypothetical protein BFP71_05965 [Roseivirga misakiensis]